MTATGNRVLRAHRTVREDIRPRHYDPKPDVQPISPNHGVVTNTSAGRGPTSRQRKLDEAERLELVARLGRAFDKAAGDAAAILAVAADAEAAGMGDLARRYRQAAG